MTEHKREEHPSYGLVQVRRSSWQGNGGGERSRLFASPKSEHKESMTLRISRAYYTSMHDHEMIMDGRQLIELELSDAQFASIMTAAGDGIGVPCTIRWFGGERSDVVPEREGKAEQIKREFEENLSDLGDELGATVKEAQEMLLKKGSMSVAERQEVASMFGKFSHKMGSSASYVLSKFNRAVEQIVESARADAGGECVDLERLADDES